MDGDFDVNPIPVRPIATLYRGVMYRSRLEARWAAFFDELSWPHEYEPIDLDFRIPDFVIPFPYAPVAVEVKPENYLSDLHGHARCVARAGWRGEVLAVGARLFDSGLIGALLEPIEGGETIPGSARIFSCLDCGAVSFLNDDYHWQCRVNGCYGGGNAHVGDFDLAEIERMWDAARNRVQWRPGT